MQKPKRKLKQRRSNITGKVIVAFLVACIALFLAFKISRDVFSDILSTVKVVSAPDRKLQLVRSLSTRITRLDQLQRTQALRNPNNYSAFLNESKHLRLTMDTLSSLYNTNVQQFNRINEMKRLLRERDKVFIDYVQQRKGLIDMRSLEKEVESVTKILSESAEHPDSAVTTTEKKISTTTTVVPAQEPENKGFFKKIFGKKKKPEEQKVVNEELNIIQDTIQSAKRDSLIRKVGKAIGQIETRQRLKSRLFASREALLLEAGNVLTGQMLNVLHQVEKEAIEQNEKNNQYASNSVNKGIERINYIIIGFLALTVILLYLIMLDVIRNKRYRRALEKARDEAEYHSMAKQRFLSNMSHEIRTPLQSIIGYSEQLKKANGSANNGVNAIYHSSIHLLQIVNEVLDYSRIISGKFTFNKKAFNIKSLLDEVVSVIEPQIQSKSLELVTEYNLPANCWLNGDPFRLKQILFNLLGNALKFTEKGRLIFRVSGKKKNDVMHFNFEVEDTGIGIAPEKLKTIFNEFEQEANDGRQTGTGLGLSIIKELIERQNGRIYVSSTYGSGSRFKFYLNFGIAAKDEITEEEILPDVVTTRRSHSKVWVVDDDRFILDLCDMILSRNRIEHETFQTASALFDVVPSQAADIIFLDLRMPEMSGFEICSKLRQTLSSDTKIYALTAQVMPEEKDEVLKAGFTGLLMKPFTEAELLRVISDAEPANDDLQNMEMIDFGVIEKMTFGDKDQMVFVLGRFVNDCCADSLELERWLADKDLEKTSLVVHRVAGRLSQFGSRELAALFRETEITLRTSASFTNEIETELLELNDILKNLYKEVDQYVADYTAV